MATQFRALPGHNIPITPGKSFIGEVIKMDCPPPAEQILKNNYQTERVYSDQSLFFFKPGCTDHSPWPIVNKRLPLSLTDLGNSMNGTQDAWGIVLGDKRTFLDKVSMSFMFVLADVLFTLSGQTETPLFFWGFMVLFLAMILHIFFGVNPRGIFRRKLALAISLPLYALSRAAISDDNFNQLSKVGVFYGRVAGLSFLWWTF